jgi:hypothetical protein
MLGGGGLNLCVPPPESPPAPPPAHHPSTPPAHQRRDENEDTSAVRGNGKENEDEKVIQQPL